MKNSLKSITLDEAREMLDRAADNYIRRRKLFAFAVVTRRIPTYYDLVDGRKLCRTIVVDWTSGSCSTNAKKNQLVVITGRTIKQSKLDISKELNFLPHVC